MRKNVVITIIIILVIAVICGLTCFYLISSHNNDNNANNTTDSINVSEIKNVSEDVEQASTSQDPHPDWVCEGSTWYSKKIGDGEYALFSKDDGHLLGTGDMPDRHGYHGESYVNQYQSTVKYRSNGEYYND